MPASPRRFARAALLAPALLIPAPALATAPDVARIPNGQALGCANCHTNNDQNNLGPFNPWGAAIYQERRAVNWGVDCPLDPDGDGYTNGQELGDPDCVWMPGAAPAEPFRSHPGDPASVPGELPPEPDAAPDPEPGEPEPGEPEPGEPEPGEPEPPPDGAVRDDGGVNAGGTVISLDDGCAIDPAAPTHWPWLLAGIGGFAAARRRRR